jgi:hypothetical protein
MGTSFAHSRSVFLGFRSLMLIYGQLFIGSAILFPLREFDPLRQDGLRHLVKTGFFL